MRTFLLLLLALAPAGALAAPIRITSGGAPLERYAAGELRRCLARMTAQPVTQGEGDGVGTFAGTPPAGFTPALGPPAGEQEIVVRSGRVAGRPAVVVTGGSQPAALWAAYALLEHLGALFEFSGETLPPRRPALDLDGIVLRKTPSITERGLRLHLNFPMDQSAYSLPEFLAWVDRIARMKVNTLMFHFYAAHPWFYFQYKDARTASGTFFVGSSMFGGKYLLSPEMIGRDLVRNKAQFFPPEMEGMAPGEALIHKTEERLRAVMARAHERGIKVAVSFEPLGLPGEIAAHLPAWEKEAGGRDRLLRDVTAARLLACMDAYPQADEYQLISVEGSSDAPADLDLKADLRRLCTKYRIPFDPEDEARFAGAKESGIHLAPYNAPESASALGRGLYRPVVSSLRFVDLALDVLADARVAERLKREGKQANVGIYLPHGPAVKLCTPALRAMIPPAGRLQMMVDYGARATADQMPGWDALRGADLHLGVITWLEFDGSMFLPQAWPRSVYDCVRNAKGLPLTSLVANHWRVSGLDADAACLAEVPWAPDEGYDTWFDGYLGRVFRRGNAPQARKAYDALEQATLTCRAHLFNVGFCWEGRFRSGFGYPQQHVETAKKQFGEARDAFAALAGALSQGPAQTRAQALADRCECARIHLDTMQEMGAAEVRPSDPPEKLKAGAEHAEAAYALAQQYMKTYARHVLDRGDEGMLVNYQYAVVQRARGLARSARQVAVLAAADARKPVMWWSFEKGDAAGVPDAAGNGFDAVAEGPVAFAPGKAGRALKLDGKGYLRVDGGGAFNPESLTISAWVHPDRLGARRGLVGKRFGNTAAPFVLGLADGSLRFEGCGTSRKFWPFNFGGPALRAGEWTHVAVTLQSGKEIILYVNGRPAARKPIDESPQPNAEPIVIGREAWGGEDGQGSPALFGGLLDEVKIWKRALSPDEVAAEAGGQ